MKDKQIVRIELIGKSKKSIRYEGRVERVDEHTITLSLSENDHKAFALAEGTPLNIWFWNNDAVYIFRTELGKLISYNSYPQIIIAKPEKISRVQERKFVRVDYVVNVIISYLNDKGEEEVIRCNCQDISGGGMLLVIDTFVPLEKGSKIKLKFTLDDTLINVNGEISWKDWKMDYKGMEHNFVGVNFINILEKDRKLIIKCVYARQIDLKKKGLL